VTRANSALLFPLLLVLVSFGLLCKSLSIETSAATVTNMDNNCNITETGQEDLPPPYSKKSHVPPDRPPVDQPWDAFLVVDVEATCEAGISFDYPNEIIVRMPTQF
jgi:hypothetical protein